MHSKKLLKRLFDKIASYKFRPNSKKQRLEFSNDRLIIDALTVPYATSVNENVVGVHMMVLIYFDSTEGNEFCWKAYIGSKVISARSLLWVKSGIDDIYYKFETDTTYSNIDIGILNTCNVENWLKVKISRSKYRGLIFIKNSKPVLWHDGY